MARRSTYRSNQVKPTRISRSRRCRFERMEPRRLLAADVAPIQVGMVYFEEATGEDEAGDVLELTFQGGADGTQLSELIIDTDKEQDGGLTAGDPLFDTAPGGEGAFASQPLVILDQTGIGSVSVDVVDGGTQLRLRFTGFEAGDRLRFSIDVEIGRASCRERV